MIVNKPQFDTSKIKPGQAYWLTKKDYKGWHYDINTPCIITEVHPLKIAVRYYSNKDKIMDESVIEINDVVDKKYILEPMSIVKSEEKEDKSEGEMIFD